MFLLIPTPTLPSQPAARYHDYAISKAHFEFNWRNPFNLSLDPVTTHSFPDENFTQSGIKTAHFYSISGPHLCSMSIREVPTTTLQNKASRKTGR
jgi:thiamine biosynthesis protein ThiC